MSVINYFINLAKQVTGLLGLVNGGTGADLSATGGTSQVLKQVSSGADITVGRLAASDLSNGVTGSGAVVLAASPTITGTLNLENLILASAGQPVVTRGGAGAVSDFVVQNVADTLNLLVVDDSGDLTILGNMNIGSGEKYEVGGAQIATTNLSDVTNTTWTVTPHNLTNVGGAPTIVGHYTKIGNLIYFNISIAPVTNTSAVNGSTFFTGLPTNPARATVVYVTDSNATNIGTSLIQAGGNIFTPTWTSDTAVIYISGVYEIA